MKETLVTASGKRPCVSAVTSEAVHMDPVAGEVVIPQLTSMLVLPVLVT